MVENLTRDRRKNSHKLFCLLAAEELKDNIGDTPDLTKIVAYFIRHNIIRQSIVNRYVVIKLYPDYIERYERKDKAVTELSKILPLEPTAIYSILSNHYTYFRPNNIDI